MAKKQFAPRVTNFSVSCDPAMLDWLDAYAIKNRSSRSRIVRKALIDFRAEHMDEPDDNAAIIDVKLRCVECDAAVIRVPGGPSICTWSSAHTQED